HGHAVPADDGRGVRDRAAQVRSVAGRPDTVIPANAGTQRLRPLLVIPAQAGFSTDERLVIQLRAGLPPPPLPSSVPESLDPRLRGDGGERRHVSTQPRTAMSGATRSDGVK